MRTLIATAFLSLSTVAVCAQTTSSLQAGKIAFLSCAACHSVDGKPSAKVGPDLKGIVGTDAGKVAGFAYSDAMKKAAAGGLKWDEATLKRWIENPASVVPSTSMVLASSLTSAQVDALISWLRDAKLPPKAAQ